MPYNGALGEAGSYEPGSGLGGVIGEPRRQVSERHGSGNGVTLQVFGSGVTSECQMLVVLDSFNDDLCTDHMGYLNGRADEGSSSFGSLLVAQERSVELDVGGGECLQKCEVRVAGSVVIDARFGYNRHKGIKHL